MSYEQDIFSGGSHEVVAGPNYNSTHEAIKRQLSSNDAILMIMYKLYKDEYPSEIINEIRDGLAYRFSIDHGLFSDQCDRALEELSDDIGVIVELEKAYE